MINYSPKRGYKIFRRILNPHFKAIATPKDLTNPDLTDKQITQPEILVSAIEDEKRLTYPIDKLFIPPPLFLPIYVCNYMDDIFYWLEKWEFPPFTRLDIWEIEYQQMPTHRSIEKKYVFASSITLKHPIMRIEILYKWKDTTI